MKILFSTDARYIGLLLFFTSSIKSLFISTFLIIIKLCLMDNFYKKYFFTFFHKMPIRSYFYNNIEFLKFNSFHFYRDCKINGLKYKNNALGVFTFLFSQYKGKEILISVSFFIKIDDKEYFEIYNLWDFIKEINNINFLLKGNNKNIVLLKFLDKIKSISIENECNIFLYNADFSIKIGHLLESNLEIPYKILYGGDGRYVQIKSKDGSLIFRDAFNIFNGPIIDFYAQFNKFYFLNKPNSIQDDIRDFSKVFNSTFLKDSIDSYVYDYNKICCEIIDIFFKDILKEYGISYLNIFGASGLAFNIINSNYENFKNKFKSLNYELTLLIKESFYGGNVFVYKNFDCNLYYYDVNSLYPYSMLNPMPVEFLGKLQYLSQKEFLNKFGFYYCTIKIDSNVKYPLVPSKNGYVTGIIEGLYFSEEVKNFISLGYDVHIQYMYEFSRVEGLFDEYIKYFYSKKELNDEFKNFYKLMLNGLYGYLSKSNQNIKVLWIKKDEIDKYLFFYDLEILEESTGFIKLLLLSRKMNFSKEELEKKKIHKWKLMPIIFRNRNIAIGSAITAYSRIYMSKYHNDDLVYSDTDSLILKKKLNKDLVGKEIGKFKLEANIDIFVCLNPKTYGYITKDNQFKMKAAGFKLENSNLNIFDLLKILKEGKVVEIDGKELKFKELESRNYIYKNNIIINSFAKNLK